MTLHKVRRTLPYTLWFLSFGLTSYAQAQTTIQLTIEGILSNQGDVYVTVTDEANFLKRDEPFLVGQAVFKASEAIDGTHTLNITDVPEGEFAITLFHDLDGNGKMKFRFMLPREPVAMSRDPKARFGPPKFKDAKLTIHGEVFSYTMGFDPKQYR